MSIQPPEKPARVRRRSTTPGPAVRAELHIETSIANDVRWRRRALERDFATFQQAAAAGERGLAQDALKRCLETLHELHEDRGWSKRG